MKKETRPLMLLESIVTNEKTSFIMESSTEAIRTTDGTKRRRSHNLRLHADTGILYWENIHGKEWFHTFDDAGQAEEWWRRMVIPRVCHWQLPKFQAG